MPVIGVADLWKIFEWTRGRKSERDERARQAVLEWLNGVHGDLCRLSKLWAKIVENVSRLEDDPRRLQVPPELFGILNIQTATGERLKSFYYGATQVLGGDFRESFLRALGGLVLIRMSARELVDVYGQFRFLSPENTVNDVLSIRAAGEALQREIAALQVLIYNFKVTELRH